MILTRQSQLPFVDFARELVGAEHGELPISILFVEARPGEGPALHKHPYWEILLVLEGRASCVVGGQEIAVEAGDIVTIPAETPHSFVNTGAAALRQVDVHLSSRFVTVWLDAGAKGPSFGGPAQSAVHERRTSGSDSG
jgi:mannose-6-phosphate isomerase-like protein (cupin superfamily)